MQKIRSFLLKTKELLFLMFAILGAIMCFGLFLKMLAPILSPVITFLFIVIGTIVALGDRRSAILSLCGFAFYGIAWFLEGQYVPGIISMLGFLSWLAGAGLGFKLIFDPEGLLAFS